MSKRNVRDFKFYLKFIYGGDITQSFSLIPKKGLIAFSDKYC